MAWHRHALALVSLYGPQQPYPAVHGPFEFCTLCRKVPTAPLGQHHVISYDIVYQDAIKRPAETDHG